MDRTFVSLSKSSVLWLYVMFAFLIFGMHNFVFKNPDFATDQQIIALKNFWYYGMTPFLILALLFTYKQYKVVNDQIEISLLFNIIFPWVLTIGARWSKFFANPFTIIKSTIALRDVDAVNEDIYNLSGNRIYCAYFVLKNGKKFRLTFDNQTHRDEFIEMVSIYLDHQINSSIPRYEK